MDILQFFVAYVFIFGFILFMVLVAHISPAFGDFVESIKIAALKIITAAVPDLLCKAVNKSIYYVFYTRNPLLQILSVFLMLLGNGVYLIEVLPVLYTFKTRDYHILLAPFVLLALTLLTFYLSCVSDPGKILTSSEASALASVYKADGVVFKEGIHCRTCKQLKPARSKHCNLCGHCVHRFDHHCLWTNNCVGGGNLRYFLLFLVALQVMVAHGTLRGIEALLLVVKNSGFLEKKVIDIGNGKHAVDNLYVLLENLFLYQPGCTLLVTSLTLLFLLIGLLFLYHVMLILNNQTTNERYKISSLPQNNLNENVERQPLGQKHHSKDNIINNKCTITPLNPNSSTSDYNVTPRIKRDGLKENDNVPVLDGQSPNLHNVDAFYNRGFLNNIKEVLLPWSEYHDLKSK